LPFDQQYDTTVIEPERGESFVATVDEAEALGFRRAWRCESFVATVDEAEALGLRRAWRWKAAAGVG
jgi:hypothetical protein